jgi:hypothetical protein
LAGLLLCQSLTPLSTSLYTNIDTAQALQVICQHVRNHTKHESTEEIYAVLEALEMSMTNNVIQFGDTYWLQDGGTAMGVSPSCVYATQYFAKFEEDLCQRYLLTHRFIFFVVTLIMFLLSGYQMTIAILIDYAMQTSKMI